MSQITDSKIKTDEVLEIKNFILSELENPGIPDIKAMFEEKNLDLVYDIMVELLDERKAKFKELLATPKEKITFEIFEDWNRFNYLQGLFGHYEMVNNSPKIREIVDKFRPLAVEFGNYVAYNKKYYEMFVYCRDNCMLDFEQKRIIGITIRDFEQSGIQLPEDKQEILKDINQKMSDLVFKFSNNVLDSEKEFEYFLENDEFIQEMPEDDKEVARAKAKEKGKDGYLFTSDSGSYLAIMKYCNNGEIRKTFLIAQNNFASSGNYDNRPLILDILKLRKKEAEILGHKNYAEYSLVDKMAESPEKILELYKQINPKAREKGLKDLQELKDFFNLEELNSWDIAYYARILKEKKYDVNDKIIKQYFEYENVLSGLFDIAKKLYDVEMIEIKAPKYNEDIKVYKVLRKGEFKSYFIMDMFYRKEKQSGAWANIIRNKQNFNNIKKDFLTVNVCSFQKGNNGITLLNLEDVETIFHEFGHVLHYFLSESKYSDLNGHNTERDFVELPSQIMENWCNEAESLKTFARHYSSGKIIPDELLEKLKKLDTFMSGNFVTRQNEFGMLDIKLHMITPPETVKELDKIAEDIRKETSLLPLDVLSKKHASFSHIFVYDYAVGYYSYLWAEIIEQDIFAQFKKAGIFNREVGDKFYNTILSQGARKPAKELFQDFMGREVSVDAYMESKGLN